MSLGVETNVMRQTYRELSATEQEQIAAMKVMGQAFYDQLSAIGASRELSLAKTKIEEAVMWATKHCTR